MLVYKLYAIYCYHILHIIVCRSVQVCRVVRGAAAAISSDLLSRVDGGGLRHHLTIFSTEDIFK